MLQSAREHYRRQQRILAAGVSAAGRARGTKALLTVVTLYQRAAATDAASAVSDMLDEQNITAPLEGRVNTDRLAGVASDGRPLHSLLEIAQDPLHNFDLIVATQLQDAARIAAGVAITGRPQVLGYTRMLNPPSCPRCAILAGKWFGWNSGFQRHPLCDCRHVPAAESAHELRTDPRKAFEAGQVRGLTQAETKALEDGADMGQVVNARRSIYMDPAGRKFTRESTTKRGSATGLQRPTPETIYQLFGDDRAAAIRALQKFAYLI